jgi:hypothetical protein
MTADPDNPEDSGDEYEPTDEPERAPHGPAAASVWAEAGAW